MQLHFNLFILIVALSLPSFANKVGNGGNGVFCKSKTESTAELLDFYEIPIKLISNESLPEKIAATQLEKLNATAPKLAAQYLKRLQEIKNEIEFKSDISLTPIPDSEHLFKPLSKDCEILQLAIRKNNPLQNEKRFIIRKDLWEQLNPVHKAGLLTHEIIYEHLSKLGEENSIKARRINRFLYEDDSSRQDFWKLMKDLELPIYP
jgi:hypothetical protein